MVTTETAPKRQRRDRIELALASVSRLSVDELAEFAQRLRALAPKFTAALAVELTSPESPN